MHPGRYSSHWAWEDNKHTNVRLGLWYDLFIHHLVITLKQDSSSGEFRISTIELYPSSGKVTLFPLLELIKDPLQDHLVVDCLAIHILNKIGSHKICDSCPLQLRCIGLR